uniref:10 kDa chaperonin n=2 Tax=Auxenochlorella protothecoides TaxID=3075 RepID=A0A1D1ZT30_AUXPR
MASVMCSPVVLRAPARPASSSSTFAPRGRVLHAGRPSTRMHAVLTAEAADLDVTKMAPLGDRVLIRPKENDQRTAGGVLLPESARQGGMDALVGTVVAVGEEAELGLESGDTVLFSKYGSSEVEIPGGSISFVQAKSVLAKLS